ncbi:PDZ domain-containing protein [Ligilactobacillus sp. LYQ60]|uniref:PDZ domain-containing protein n=1 Tax=Ligilactobacillus sp. LYQ60 TaxID=3378799 RepID=UPI003852A5EC
MKVVGWLLGAIVFNPLLWLGGVMPGINYLVRIRQERHQWRQAVDRDWYEGRHFIMAFGGMALIGIGGTILMRVTVSWELVAVYGFLAGIVALTNWWHNLTPLLILVPVGLTLITKDGGALHATLVFTVFICITRLILSLFGGQKVSPRMVMNRRHHVFARYEWRETTILPVFVMVGTRQGPIPIIIFFPVGIHRVIQEKTTAPVVRHLQMVTGIQCGLALLGSFTGYSALRAGLGVALVMVSCYDIGNQWWRIHHHSPVVTAATDGIRVVAVRPATPAARMGLRPGDVVVACNDAPVHNHRELYAALQRSAAYCRLRVRTVTGDMKLVESSLYAGVPHEVGIVTFPAAVYSRVGELK